MTRANMETVHGMSVRVEIDARIALACKDARARAFEEAIRFLGGAGMADAAELLRAAAFDPPQNTEFSPQPDTSEEISP
ncbi:MAG: hypothetical protein KIS86_12970 [Devosia sp.]|nr:hypothetical protein [Devosia sp.]